jgi:hypothetical protein
VKERGDVLRTRCGRGQILLHGPLALRRQLPHGVPATRERRQQDALAGGVQAVMRRQPLGHLRLQLDSTTRRGQVTRAQVDEGGGKQGYRAIVGIRERGNQLDLLIHPGPRLTRVAHQRHIGQHLHRQRTKLDVSGAAISDKQVTLRPRPADGRRARDLDLGFRAGDDRAHVARRANRSLRGTRNSADELGGRDATER